MRSCKLSLRQFFFPQAMLLCCGRHGDSTSWSSAVTPLTRCEHGAFDFHWVCNPSFSPRQFCLPNTEHHGMEHNRMSTGRNAPAMASSCSPIQSHLTSSELNFGQIAIFSHFLSYWPYMRFGPNDHRPGAPDWVPRNMRWQVICIAHDLDYMGLSINGGPKMLSYHGESTNPRCTYRGNGKSSSQSTTVSFTIAGEPSNLGVQNTINLDKLSW